MIVIDNKYEYTPITQKETPLPVGQLEFVRREIYDYFGVNEDIVQNKADAEKMDAFYRGQLAPFYMQLAQGLTNALFTSGSRVSEMRSFASWIVFSLKPSTSASRRLSS